MKKIAFTVLQIIATMVLLSCYLAVTTIGYGLGYFLCLGLETQLGWSLGGIQLIVSIGIAVWLFNEFHKAMLKVVK